MKKLAFDPQTISMLKGIGSTAALGAGAGALGMGATNLLAPNDPENKKRSLLKSMLLGGALGGVAGAGGRVAWNYMDPSMKVNEGSGAEKLLEGPKPEQQTPPTHPSLLSAAAGYPITTGLAAGAGGALAPGIAKKLNFIGDDPDTLKGKGFMDRMKYFPSSEKNLSLLRVLKNLGRHKGAMGTLAGGTTTGLGYYMQEPLINQAQYDAVNTDPGTLKQYLLQQQQGQPGQQ